jgi:hypothetical protein
MRCFVLQCDPCVQTVVEVVRGEEYLIQTNDETRLISRDLTQECEELPEATGKTKEIGLRIARGAVRRALTIAQAREQYYASNSTGTGS